MKKKKVKKNITENVVKNLEELIFPTLDSLRRRSALPQKKQIDVLKKNLRNITSDFGKKVSSREWKLSKREVEACNLIKEGLTTVQIANILCTSKKTIDNHRNRIRKKLRISKSKIRLDVYLKSLE